MDNVSVSKIKKLIEKEQAQYIKNTESIQDKCPHDFKWVDSDNIDVGVSGWWYCSICGKPE